MAIDIRPVDLTQAGSTADWLDLLNAYASDPMGSGAGLSDDIQQRLPEQLRDRPGTWLFLAYEDDQPVGLLNSFESFSTFGAAPVLNIHDVYVAHSARGKGVVDALFAEAEHKAQTIGCCKMTLEVLEHNTPARRAYRRLGFDHYVLDPSAGGAQFWEKKLN